MSIADDAQANLISTVVSRITANVATAPTASEMVQQMAMTESNFSRFFRRATGNKRISGSAQIQAKRVGGRRRQRQRRTLYKGVDARTEYA